MSLSKAFAALFVAGSGLWPAGPALADSAIADTSRAGDECAAGGILYAPRYLAHGGSFEIGIGVIPLVNFSPRSPGVPFIAEVGTLFKPVEGGPDAYLQIGPEPKFGLRNRLLESETGAVGWSAGYREDMAFRGAAFGLGRPYFGLLPMSDVSSSKGGEVALDSFVKAGPLYVLGSPRAAWMSNGLRLGGTLGLTLDFDRALIGYDLDLTRNVAFAPADLTGLPDAFNFMVMHGLGLRVLVSNDMAVQANYYIIPRDFFGNRNQLGSVGLYYRYRGK